jgi:hypothetical protein
MKETLEQLEEKYFMLQMQDRWGDSEYKYADELKEKIKKLKEQQNGEFRNI